MRPLSKFASDNQMQEDLGAQNRSSIGIHEDSSTKSTTQLVAEVEFRKRSIEVDLMVPSRLDRYLKRVYKNITQGLLERWLRKKLILLNNHKAKSKDHVQKGDFIQISHSLNLLDHDAVSDQLVFSDSVKKLAENVLTKYLLFKHEHFIAVNKPSGIATQGGTKISISIDHAIKYLNSKGNDFRIVHRLDKDTSGILLIATSHFGAYKLTCAFKDNSLTKTYLAFVHGHLAVNEGIIEDRIQKSNFGVVKGVVDCKNGKIATTRFKVMKHFDNYMLVIFIPRTGRTHQIRYHAAKLGCPIIGDNKYGQVSSDRGDNTIHATRTLLHAKSILIPSQVFNDEVLIDAPLPDDFNVIS